MLTLLANFEGVADPQVKLSLIVYVIRAELAGLEYGQELSVPRERGIGTQISCGFERLVLQDGGAHGLEGGVMLKGEPDGFLNGDPDRWGGSLGGSLGRRWGGGRRNASF